jgi:AraC-like DNA-binding protein
LSKEDFDALFNLLGGEEAIRGLKLGYASNTPKKMKLSKLCAEDRLLMFLLRLRRGLPLEELAYFFKLSVSYVSDICYAMTRLTYLTLKSFENHMFTSAAEQKKNKPKLMRPFPNLRIILDGAAFYIQMPSNFEQQGNTYSSYKSHNTVLFMLGISCSGGTIFCSMGFEGSMSDKEAILKSGLLQRLDEKDCVMTDRGFDLTAELQAIGCKFVKPPSVGERQSLTAEEELATKALAAARIYVEHAVADIKDNRLLQGVIPLTLLPVLSDLVYIAAFLRNLSSSRVKNEKVVAGRSGGDKLNCVEDYTCDD